MKTNDTNDKNQPQTFDSHQRVVGCIISVWFSILLATSKTLITQFLSNINLINVMFCRMVVLIELYNLHCKAYQCWVKRLCIVWDQESSQEWRTFPLSCLRMEARQQQQSWYAEDLGDKGIVKGMDTIAYDIFSNYQRKASSSNVRTIMPLA